MQHFIDSLSFNMIIIRIEPSDDTASPCARIIRVNRSATEFLGYSEQELLNQSFEKILATQKERTLWQTALAKMNNNLANSYFEGEIITRAQHKIQVSLSISPLLDPPSNNKQAVVLIQVIMSDNNCYMMNKVVEQSASAVMITDPTGRIDYVNPKFTELTGYTADELLGQNPKILQSGNMSSEHYQTMWQTLLASGEWRGEIQNQKKNGEVYWAYENVSAIKNSAGEITHFLAVEEDITRRKEVESALSESEERFRQMAEITGEWLWEQDPDGYYTYSSSAVNQILGFSMDEVIGKHYTEFLTPQDKASLQPYSAIHQPFYALLNHYRHKDGHQVLTESTGLPIIDVNGKLLKWRGVDRDITARKHFQDALIESEKRTRLIIESALSAIVIMDSYGIITDWNHQAEKMFGWSRSEAIDQRLQDLIIPPRFRKAHQKGLQHFLHTGIGPLLNQVIEHVAIRKNGSEFPVELSISPLKLGNAYIFSGFIHDITHRKRLEHRFRQAVESAPNAIVMVNQSGIIEMVNSQTETSFGYLRTELIGQPVEMLVPERFRTAHIGYRQAYLATPVSRPMGVGQDLYGLRKDGTEFPVEIGLSLIDNEEEVLVMSTIIEITARKAAEQQIRQAQVSLAIAQNEIRIAQQIQATLSPSAPIKSDDFEVTGFCLPADKVGGDYFDYFFRNEAQLDMVIADVSGHSIGPALFMVETRSAMRAQTNLLATPAETLGVLNSFLFNDLDQSDYFITLFYLQVDINKHQVRFANAGHPPPLLLSRSQQKLKELDTEGLILGVKKEVVFEEKTTILAKGDLILFYTDGIIEAENQNKEFFGLGRVKAVLLQKAHEPPQIIIDSLLAALQQFCQRTSFDDDITLMIFKCR